jgi:catechol 2,3-dioxygenase
MSPNPPVISGTRIGHVHLKVADLERALGFYCDVLGFELQQRRGDSAAFISARARPTDRSRCSRSGWMWRIC